LDPEDHYDATPPDYQICPLMSIPILPIFAFLL
jgi:hypothetical protein